jgi:hypothetical protein
MYELGNRFNLKKRWMASIGNTHTHIYKIHLHMYELGNHINLKNTG